MKEEYLLKSGVVITSYSKLKQLLRPLVKFYALAFCEPYIAPVGRIRARPIKEWPELGATKRHYQV
jgi:hypothetical protein